MEEVSEYELSSAIQISWFEDGDHDLKPRKRVSGFTHDDHIRSMGSAVAAWVEGLFWLESTQHTGFAVFAGFGWAACSAQPAFNIGALMWVEHQRPPSEPKRTSE